MTIVKGIVKKAIKEHGYKLERKGKSNVFNVVKGDSGEKKSTKEK